MTALQPNSPASISVYPGGYTPYPFDWDVLVKELNKPHKDNTEPLVNVRELDDHFIVELMAPGHSKDDFIVNVNDSQLSIVVISHKMIQDDESYKLHEFNMDCFSHVIDLPKNIDTDFIRAEYAAGILSICFPKMEVSTPNLVHRIIIY